MSIDTPTPHGPAPERIATLAARLSGAQSLADADLAEVADLMGAAMVFAFVNASAAPFDRQRFAVMLEAAMDNAADFHHRIIAANERRAAG